MFPAMITYEAISKRPQAAMSLIGMPLAEFEKLYTEFEIAHIARKGALQHTRRYKVQRRRSIGAGRKFKYSLRDRLLMTLFWLRAYTTYEVLGFIYDLDKTTVQDNLNDVLDTLALMKTFHLERPQRRDLKLQSMQELMGVFPDLRVLIQTKE
jgi:hypothetical protein